MDLGAKNFWAGQESWYFLFSEPVLVKQQCMQRRSWSTSIWPAARQQVVSLQAAA